jgi:hypothetical protein
LRKLRNSVKVFGMVPLIYLDQGAGIAAAFLLFAAIYTAAAIVAHGQRARFATKYRCFYCERTFEDAAECRRHRSTHEQATAEE